MLRLVYSLALVVILAIAVNGRGLFYGLQTDHIIPGPPGHNQFGREVFDAKDINNDGNADMITRQYGSPSREAKHVGPVALYLGPLDAVASADDYDFSFQPKVGVNGSYHARFGELVVTGDVNHDGYDDLIMSSQVTITAYVYVFFGPFTKAPDGSARKVNLTLADADIVLNGDPLTTGSTFGHAIVVCEVDSVPGMDLVIGDPTFNVSGTDTKEGAIFVYTGPLTGTQYSVADASLALEGTIVDAKFSDTLRCADVNGVPGDELIVAEPGYGSAAGRVLIFDDLHAGGRISAQFVGPLISTVFPVPSGGNITLMIPNGFANAIDVVDFNGDGENDVIIACYQYPTFNDADPDDVMRGEVYVFWGPFGSARAADDPYTRETANVIIAGVERNEMVAGGVLGVPSLNPDGINDLVLAMPHYGRLRGKLVIFHGLNVSSDHPQIRLTTKQANAVLHGARSQAGFGYSMAYAGFVSNQTHSALLISSPFAPDGFSVGRVSLVQQVPTACPYYGTCKSCVDAGCVWCKGDDTCTFASPSASITCPGNDITLLPKHCPGFNYRELFIAIALATGVCFGLGLLASRLKRLCCSEDAFQREARLKKQADAAADDARRAKLHASLQVTVEDIMYGRGDGFGPALDFGSINSDGGPVRVVGADRIQQLYSGELDDVVAAAVAVASSPVDDGSVDLSSPGKGVGASSSAAASRPPVPIRLNSTGSIATLSSTDDDLAHNMATFSKRKGKNLSVNVSGELISSTGSLTTPSPLATPTTPKLRSPQRHHRYNSDSSTGSTGASGVGMPPTPTSGRRGYFAAAPPPSPAAPASLPTGAPPIPPKPDAPSEARL
ncbi:uncharacterized protein AMSG_01053 [Thecamonas trahens ATCC 50062]|uniref:Integrin alpha N-terminal domain-containing protein n=1 Tax=Thecamonas trahens ATCC 50062 TaxID=461836 RepID=A0A0L0DJ48_THETB|nr:hypothetical protein AMSG_01053 [Thecamonas trahens ATCC 50062]KNC52225.1 hypothetical protein AMSG_01053 [Thecamonas trahens ATCC 50062]|eukprot:XP_013762227.1 hypothetical protein AMSG_01053 [Thecamonas trahens ATCC 50062]